MKQKKFNQKTVAYGIDWELDELWESVNKLQKPSLLTETAYYLGLACLLLAGFILGNILMFAYLIIIK